ncbi:NADH dehydrogenase [ubiquinone] 1 beta subcomplex subunit 5, mitochondrial [Colletes gigas]|uniref:NADH dehydrogenase [ubiquinone] 1 beta subcomplex subunit 5, mitochondrial n=1 Tax=Colletes gigas TaxID=935657 RepID=UPI001C9B90BE|nr:NADH dehydrogenase [ubiquinone] 1 beta subcomplex subunit 5, mitochondrial [Colletes gigas]
MTVLSRFLMFSGPKLFKPNGLEKVVPKNGIIRCMSEEHTMKITPSEWQWTKLKDWLHFYFFLGAIPALSIMFYANVFIGPATLEPIPEGYDPKPWEYFRSPITRFMVKYFTPNRQQEYEKYICVCVQAFEKKRMKDLEVQVKQYIDERQDYPSYSYRRSTGSLDLKRYREMIESHEQ